MQTIKNLSHHQKTLSGQTYLPPNRIPETLAGHVGPTGQTYPASQAFLDLTKHIRLLGRIPEAFPEDVRLQPGHVQPNPIPQRLSPGSDISGPQVGFQRG
jgi:hypothetical protein